MTHQMLAVSLILLCAFLPVIIGAPVFITVHTRDVLAHRRQQRLHARRHAQAVARTHAA